MPAAPSGKVLVTGTNGYISSQVTIELLKAGYGVRGTMRREGLSLITSEFLKELNARLSAGGQSAWMAESLKEWLEVVIMLDITKVCIHSLQKAIHSQ